MKNGSRSGLKRSDLHEKIVKMEQGSRKVVYEGRHYLLSLQHYAKGKVVKIWAEELGGNDFISANYYPTLRLLKPCEMPVKKVETFLLSI